jgi:hypothetical protein
MAITCLHSLHRDTLLQCDSLHRPIGIPLFDIPHFGSEYRRERFRSGAFTSCFCSLQARFQLVSIPWHLCFLALPSLPFRSLSTA